MWKEDPDSSNEFLSYETHISVEDDKPETYLPTEGHWSGYVRFAPNQNRFLLYLLGATVAEW